MKLVKSAKHGFVTQPHAQANDRHEVFMYGVVGWDINVQKLFTELRNMSTNVRQLDLYWDSPGGLLYPGLTMLTNLRRLKNDFYIRNHIDGLAGSMSSALSVTGNETIASPTSQMMIHDAMYTLDIYGGFNRTKLEELIEDLEDIHEELESGADVFAVPYATRTGMSIAEVKERWLDDGKDHWLNPQQMLDAGLIDKIATEDFAQPPGVEEENDEDFLVNAAAGMKAAITKGRDLSPYCGVSGKMVAAFAFNGKNSDTQNSSSPGRKPESKQTKEAMNELQIIARALDMNPDASAESIRDTVAELQSDLSDAEATVSQQSELIDELKEAKSNRDETISDLQSQLLNSQTGSVIDEVCADVTKEDPQKQVNKNIRSGQLEDLATQHLQAKADGNETLADNLKEHMTLLAEKNLVPIGKNKELEEDEDTTRTDLDTGLTSAKLEKAEKDGKKAAEKENARRNKYRKTAN